MNSLRICTAGALVLAGLSTCLAQSTTGTITGLVTDSSGAVIPDAVVIATNSATGVRAQTVTSSTGNYVIPSLQVGTYELSVSLTGFKTWTRSGIRLSSNDNARVDVALEIGQTSERVQVTAEAPPLKTESTEVSTVMENKLVNDMPLAVAGIGGGMRNAFSIMMMMPQVKSGNGESAWDDLQVGGGQQHDWNVSVDGLSVEMGWRNHVGYMNRLTPAVDAVQEFRIETAAFKAEDSRASGGNISITTKSGTNDLHGSLFDYYQTQRLNANSWLNNKLGRRKAVFHRNDFGANVGGPIYLPKVYNGRNRSYFFFSYEGYRFPQTVDAPQLTIPPPEMITGDFSNWKTAAGAVIPIYDPGTTRSDGRGGFTREPFEGNRIPQNRLSPLSRAIAAFYPKPNAPGLVRNFISTGTEPKKRIENAYVTKIDQSFGTKNRLSFTYTRNGEYFNNAYDSDYANPRNWAGLPFPFASSNGRRYYRGDQYYGNVGRLNDTHVFTPTVVNVLTIGAHRLTHPEHDITVEPFGQNWGDKLGGNVKNNPFNNYGFPSVGFANDNYTGWDSSKLWDEYHTVYGLDENLTWVRGSHSFKFGYSYQILMLNINNRNNAAGTYSFNRLSTAVPGDNSGRSGNAFASFMLGEVYSGNFTVPNTQALRFPYHAFFVQDDWKITPRLTMNAGLRYEVNIGVYEKHDKFSFFDPNLPNPAASGYPGALRFLGSGPGREGRRNLWNNAAGWGPRFGLAYQLTPAFVVRAGGGIFYASNKAPGLGGANNGFANSPSWSSPDQGVNSAFQWDKGVPGWEMPPFINPGFNAGFGVPWWGADETGRLPQTISWNFALSRAVGTYVFDATYTGSKGTHLASDRVNVMQIDPKYAYLGTLLNKQIDDPEVVALAFRPPFANFKQLMGNNATLGQALRRFPQYTGVSTGGMMNHSGNSTYHAMILKTTKRFSGGLTLLASYTWSKLLTDADSSEPWIAGVVGAGIGAGGAQNHYNRRVEKSYGVLDLPHMFKLTGSYDLPFGKGRRYLTGGVASRLLGNWNISSFMFAQSGYPIGVVDSAYSNNLRGGTARPDITSHEWRAATQGDKFDPSVDNFFVPINSGVFVRRINPAVNPFGNAPRFIGNVRSFPVYRTNAAIAKGFRILEEATADIKLEIFDLWNQKTWNRPASLDLANSQFGVITSASGNRTMQLGLKFVF
ncbi:MAG TPA: carboxypeptidase regulatory-like domain-containing protein [Bryobacteraceae bacterium]|nr:carboxypeptidase regulatory-like domain-containing protein [Bryobacteraceae bacterium]